MKKRYGCIIITVLLLLILGVTGCGPKPKADTPSVSQPEPAPGLQEPPEESQNSAESAGHGSAVAFKGTDFLTGEEVQFEPGESARPAIISFFSPG